MGTGKMVSTTDSFLQWHCAYDYNTTVQRVYGTWNQIIFILAKYPTQSHTQKHTGSVLKIYKQNMKHEGALS